MSKNQRLNIARIATTVILFGLGEFAPFPAVIAPYIFIVAFIVAGYSALIAAIRNVIKGHMLDENFLMSIAGVGAILLGQYDEACAVMLFYLIGSIFEEYAVNKSRNSISDLMDIRPDEATLLTDGTTKIVDPYDVPVGSILLVKPGEKIPLDGIVIEGTSSIDTKALTGESLGTDVVPGSSVISGCINLNGMLKIRSTKEFGESTVSKVLDLVENAGSKKAEVEKFITTFAKYYTPIVVALAGILALLPPILLGEEFGTWVYRALLFLVISCPCALVISVPLSFFGGVGAASKAGVLVKGSNYLEALSRMETIIFDKTGTLTSGDFSVTEIHAVDCAKEEVLTLAAYVEYYSNHPIADSIRNAYNKAVTSIGEEPSINEELISNYQEIAGKGSSATLNGKMICAGNAKLMELVNIHDLEERSDVTIVHVSADTKYLGYIALSDTIKEGSKDAIDRLHAIGIDDTIMLTGDRKAIADRVAYDLGIETVFSQLLPNEKVDITEEILEDKTPGKNVAFVGDGINDAPVLARVDIGIAMGGLGSEAAIEAADVVIMDDNLNKIPTVINIAKKTLAIAKQNVVFALVVKFLILALGAFGIATMWMAIFADVGVSIIAILNAMRTLLIKSK